MVVATALFSGGLFVFCVIAGLLRLFNVIKETLSVVVRSQGVGVGRICSIFVTIQVCILPLTQWD